MQLYCSGQYIVSHNAWNSREFYTGWLTHWGEKIAKTDADFTASYLEKILSQNGSAVLYVCTIIIIIIIIFLVSRNCLNGDVLHRPFLISDGTWWDKLWILQRSKYW